MNNAEREQLRRAAEALDAEVAGWQGRLGQLQKEMRAAMARLKKTLAALGASAAVAGAARPAAAKPAAAASPRGAKPGRARIPGPFVAGEPGE